MSHILVTGGAGFIGANFVLEWLRHEGADAVVNVDKLTYAGNRNSLAALDGDVRHVFVQADICDGAAVTALLHAYRPRAIVHFAAESHVDRSIAAPGDFVQTNVVGTFRLLEAALAHWRELDTPARNAFRFLHVSTDEVFGSLAPADPPFTEASRYQPSSPYSASKAASDHMVRAYHHTYGLPVLISNCSNNYGPLQFPEKLIPMIITGALAGRPLPLYGDGRHVRDWLYVGDHCAAIRGILDRGKPGETYNVGGWNEKTNLEVVQALCDLLDELSPRPSGSYREQIVFVKDRPGHDRRYAVDARKIAFDLGWKPTETLGSGLRKTVRWYLENPDWIRDVLSGEYRNPAGAPYVA
ncbi:dTDP-glucose 4,6-dehydratase [Cupriavidus nantongensis]|uniref:dTDP-glucose 4,6-dehydratase n=1 Tax=Cupriavidus nantongensis TaxID=1796606 RepID=A0A142JN68_9BURK|nr:dTDP-glucose 4,6-dehydratase [Cupriavidus nantongensis]AMR79530.1 dTDP-glucose 4,6-dehydratase [Cupriavidus nantongensis]